MPRFFVKASDITESEGTKTVSVRGDDASHITRVLRMKLGERVTVCDDCGIEYETVVCRLGNEVLLDVLEEKRSENEPEYKVRVFQALVKGDRFDTVLQKATELGAGEIIPVITSRCTVKLTEADYSKKTERWQRIAYEAAKQCGRGMIPKVSRPTKFKDAIEMMTQDDMPLFCYEGEGTVPLPEITKKVQSPETISVMIGPEGGYEPDEAEYAKERGINLVGLGHRILRTETAAPFVLSCLSYEYEL